MSERPAAQGTLIERVVIGIFGNKQHGKDTVARMLREHLLINGKRTKSFALADPVKAVAMALVGMPIEVAAPSWHVAPEGEDTNALRLAWSYKGRNGREWLQWCGTELGRVQIAPDIWVDRAVGTVVDDGLGTQVFLISDCRFHNERVNLRLKMMGVLIKFVTVRVRRPGVPVELDHPSESEVASMTDDQFDYVIANDGTLAQLEHKVKEYAVSLGLVEA